MLTSVKLLLGITDTNKDGLLTLLIKNATQEAVMMTNNADVNALESVIIKMVIYNYNRLGTEGLDSESYSGVSYNYTSNYPDDILTLLQKCKKFDKLQVLW